MEAHARCPCEDYLCNTVNDPDTEWMCSECWLFSLHLCPTTTPLPFLRHSSHTDLCHGSVSHGTLILGSQCCNFYGRRAQDPNPEKSGSHHGTLSLAVCPRFTYLVMRSFMRFKLNKVCKSLAHCLARSK